MAKALQVKTRTRAEWRAEQKAAAAERQQAESSAYVQNLLATDPTAQALREAFRIRFAGREQRGYAANARRLLAIERHQQRELAVCQTQRPQRRVKATRYCPRGPLQMQAEAGVAHIYGDREGKMLFT